MEPDKFETYIKSKLDAREIAPTQGAWDKIAKELKSEPIANTPHYFWLGIAASVTVLLGVTIFYLNTGEKELSTQELVETPSKTSVEKVKEVMGTTALENSNGLVLEQADVQGTKGIKPVIVPSDTVLEPDFIRQKQADAIFVEVNQQERQDVQMPTQLFEAILKEKITEVVAQVRLLESTSKVTDAEVDSLLRNAQRTILKERLFKPDQSVDAMALLAQVEEELDQSFRDQIFQSLKTGFLKVRTAVADRNN
ncbi:hypothetical protein [Maribacter antarcticus]|uniref:hypothetical protein n=1 Tax=Maribacter antarcticus TaxID=505250 RepID=UPI00047DABDD|nr:hypothetical protein [Maribacter antarcticus]